MRAHMMLGKQKRGRPRKVATPLVPSKPIVTTPVTPPANPFYGCSMVVTIELMNRTCKTCSVPFAFPKELNDNCFENGGYIFCPNGHQWGWGKGKRERDADDLKSQLMEAERELALRVSQNDQLAAELVNVKSQHAQLEKRVTNGLCPCPHCKRPFANLARHMKAKHPNMVSSQR